MKWDNIELSENDKDYGYMYGKRSDNENWEIMIGVVMYGFRVYLRPKGSMVFTLDLCGGRPEKSVKFLYSFLETHLSKDKPMRELIGEVPEIKIKPYFNDAEFLSNVTNLIRDIELIENDITQEGLEEGRNRCFGQFSNNTN